MDNNIVFNTIENYFKENATYSDKSVVLVTGDSLEEMKKIPSHTVALILTDPPYHSTKKKNIAGDTAFDSNDDYVRWLECYAKEWKRILKYNGSVFCFCSSAMSARLQNMFSKEFNILTEIVWTKPNEPGYDGWKQKMKKEALRQWYPYSERIIFMEPAYEGNLFNSYFGNELKKWRKEAKMSAHDLAEITKSYGKINHGGAVCNWEAGRNIPSRDQYNKIVSALLQTGKFTSLPDYEDVIRPFNVNRDVEFTDIWNFKNVRQYRGKHPAEKPQDLLTHAILSTTYEGDIVLDCFGGSGATALAAKNAGRRCVSIEIEEKWSNYSKRRILKVESEKSSLFDDKK
ncbi:MAG: site-specific DNA-methyltransferase [Succiniclasticum sp.]|uniref:DNA-methyltransferase n=1 Tax=Succiniclasticum sp. TaxID=2775030 RepID=UPI002A91A9EB|nr:site-specific DNA-methyltransferase [Succiniclasticum sp.]MDY6292003.1 site-specific DNA-methyltransferase [Succiniclasticum sp.]